MRKTKLIKLTIIYLSYLLCTNIAYPEDIDPEKILKTTRRITEGIYNDVLLIKDNYEELKDFDDNFFRKGLIDEYGVLTPSIEYVYCPAMYNLSYTEAKQTYCNPQPPCFHLRVIFLYTPCTKEACEINMICPEGVESQIYIEEIGRFLIFSQRSGNAELDAKLIEIFRNHTKEYKIKEMPWQ